eukprot:scaffold39551_cov45-Tisochrysis_lutea.AAC.1
MRGGWTHPGTALSRLVLAPAAIASAVRNCCATVSPARSVACSPPDAETVGADLRGVEPCGHAGCQFLGVPAEIVCGFGYGSRRCRCAAIRGVTDW